MKKNKIITFLNWTLLFSLPLILLTVNVKKDEVSKEILPKKLSTSLMANINNNKVEKQEEKVEEEQEEKEEKQEEVIEKDIKEIDNNDINLNNKVEEVIPVVEQKSDVLRSYTGKMSFYNANCAGCNGVTSTGTDISDGRLYYYDNTYGNLRIIAAGTEIKKWSVVRLKNTSLGANVLAIVLDRGGAIGEGKTFLIDMLTNAQENKGGVERNIIVEVLRDGK